MLFHFSLSRSRWRTGYRAGTLPWAQAWAGGWGTYKRSLGALTFFTEARFTYKQQGSSKPSEDTAWHPVPRQLSLLVSCHQSIFCEFFCCWVGTMPALVALEWGRQRESSQPYSGDEMHLGIPVGSTSYRCRISVPSSPPLILSLGWLRTFLTHLPSRNPASTFPWRALSKI